MATFLRNQDFGDQIRIAQTGRLLGDALNKIALPSFDTRVAVTAAGGIAMTYKGRIIDLLGLNWPKMAHAKGRRTGTPGHSAFVEKIFWDEMPELVLPSISDKIPPNVGVRDYISKFLDGLPESSRFKNEYKPVAIPVSNRYIVVFARRDWINKYLKVGKLIRI